LVVLLFNFCVCVFFGGKGGDKVVLCITTKCLTDV